MLVPAAALELLCLSQSQKVEQLEKKVLFSSLIFSFEFLQWLLENKTKCFCEEIITFFDDIIMNLCYFEPLDLETPCQNLWIPLLQQLLREQRKTKCIRLSCQFLFINSAVLQTGTWPTWSRAKRTATSQAIEVYTEKYTVSYISQCWTLMLMILLGEILWIKLFHNDISHCANIRWWIGIGHHDVLFFLCSLHHLTTLVHMILPSLFPYKTFATKVTLER